MPPAPRSWTFPRCGPGTTCSSAVEQPFPQLEALTTLAVLAAQTREITLGTGILVLPMRDPALLAKTAATIQDVSSGRLRLGVAAGWYEREFDATGTPFKGRGGIFERNLEICMRLWTEDEVTGEWGDLSFRRVRMLPQPQPRPELLIGGYVDRVLRRVATLGDGWLTYFYTAEAFTESWAQDHAVRRGGRPRPGDAAQRRTAPAVHRLVVRAGAGAHRAVARRLLRHPGVERRDARTARSSAPPSSAPSSWLATSRPGCRRSA